MKLKELPIFTMTDQPTTCAKCGCRTDYYSLKCDGVTERQIHICLGCGELFVVEDEI